MLKRKFSNSFAMKDLGVAKQILGMRITRDKKNVVSAVADVGHLRNRARNTRKLEILMFEGFMRKKKPHENRKNKKLKRNPRV